MNNCIKHLLLSSLLLLTFSDGILLIKANSSKFASKNLSRIRRQNNCGDGNFTCANGSCISEDFECDGKEDCLDGSDENDNCKYLSCQTFSFTCDYGACINKNFVCNGQKNCKDNSDERPPACNRTSACGNNEFSCLSGQCINEYDICDGKTHCSDKSDETLALCGSLTCQGFTFQCNYGACISREKMCNNVQDCADGSDEATSLCPKIGNKNPKPEENGKCLLPDYPEHGKYFIVGLGQTAVQPGTRIDSSTVLTFTCDQNYALSPNINLSICLSRKWSPSIPQCVPVCESTDAVNEHIIVECSLHGNLNSSCQNPVHGTIARFRCKPFYEDLNLNKLPIRTCKNGTWDGRFPVCSPTCGQKTGDAQQLIINGIKAKKGNYPWQAAVFSRNHTNFQQICGATIISLKAVLSAAHCFTSYNGTRYSSEKYVIGAGKYYRSYSDERDTDTAQFSEIKEIKIPQHYIGDDGNYASDIAVVILRKEFIASKRVQPICIDWSHIYESRQLVPNATGLITGWGYTVPDGKSSDELQELEVPFIPFSLCNKNVPKDFQKFITQDKICSGYLSQGRSVCQGDSGGGLVFESDGRFYIRGIVSVSPKKDNFCDPNQYALYTLVSFHIKNNYQYLFNDI